MAVPLSSARRAIARTRSSSSIRNGTDSACASARLFAPSYASTIRPTIGWRTTSALLKRVIEIPSTPSSRIVASARPLAATPPGRSV
ncbi:hypothetical protein WR25_14117 [Diploscapter pachys]|uniref:Uncharacterized protein n=1 Tax=Diploscapter pachys TaxID=2018661 RepID=A0A2A2KLX6_9BILA|nr:hypothetical protein WR25_14117 [Diploscapter pachys]